MVSVTDGKNKSKCIKEIQGKSILVRVSLGRVLGSQLYTDCTTSTSFIYWEELTFKIAFELS